MIIIDTILGICDWVKIKTNRKSGVWPVYWWPQDNSLKTCIKTRIIERKLKKI